jgi:hypothetical protein
MQKPLLAFTAPARFLLRPPYTVLAAHAAVGPAAHHAIHRKRRSAMSPAARPARLAGLAANGQR